MRAPGLKTFDLVQIQLCIDDDTTIDLSPLRGAFNSEGVTTTTYKKKVRSSPNTGAREGAHFRAKFVQVEVAIPKTYPGEMWETLIAKS